jgi:hypothetical protein
MLTVFKKLYGWPFQAGNLGYCASVRMCTRVNTCECEQMCLLMAVAINMHISTLHVHTHLANCIRVHIFAFMDMHPFVETLTLSSQPEPMLPILLLIQMSGTSPEAA